MLTKQTNTRQTNAWGTNKLQYNPDLTIVKSKNNIAWWIQPMRPVAQHHKAPFFVHDRKILLYSLWEAVVALILAKQQSSDLKCASML